MTQSGRFYPPARQIIIYGESVQSALPRVLSDFWVRHSIFVTNSSVSKPDMPADTIRAILGDGLVRSIRNIRVGAPREDVMEVTTALRGTGIEAVIGLGGGSVAETIKAARVCLTNNIRDVEDVERLKLTSTIAPPRPYFISIPTTLSGAEYTPVAGVTDLKTGVKEAFDHPDMAPDAVILDPEMTLATPAALWLGTGLQSLDHAIETYCAQAPTPYSDATAAHAFKELHKWLPLCAKDASDLAARSACQMAGWLSIQGAAIGVPHGTSHGIAHALNAVAGIPASVSSPVILPHVLRFNEAFSAERQAYLAQTIGRQGTALGDIVAELAAELALPSRLRDIGVTREMISAIAEQAMADVRIATNIRPFTGISEMERLIKAAY